MSHAYVGIDVSKLKLDPAILNEAKYTLSEFANNESDYERLLEWARAQAKGKELRFCMESTGPYSLGIAQFLKKKGEYVSVVNPRKVKNLAIALSRMQKTDKVDSKLIADFAEKVSPDEWQLADPDRQELSAVMNRLHYLQKWIQAESNRLEDSHLAEVVRKDIELAIQQQEERCKTLNERVEQIIKQSERMKAFSTELQKKKGVALKTATLLIAELDPMDYVSAQNCAAYFGLNPVVRQTGNAPVYTTVSRQGNSRLRSALYFPTITAMCHDEAMKAFGQKLRDKGKSSAAARVACMRKLLMQCYGIMKRVDRDLAAKRLEQTPKSIQT